jgi:hypothetical protein
VPKAQLIVVPLLVGVLGTLCGGSAAAGRRIARLAAFSAGLYVFLYGTLAIAALGLGGPPGDPGCTGSCNIGDRLGTNTIFYLWLLPLTTAGIGWAAAAATARLRSRPAPSMVAVPFVGSAGLGEWGHGPVTVPEVTPPVTSVPEMTIQEEALPEEALPAEPVPERLPAEVLPGDLARHEAGRAVRVRGRHRTVYVLLVCAVVVAALFLLALGMHRG